MQWFYWQSSVADAKVTQKKATLILVWSHRYRNYTVSITNYQFLKWQWIFSLLRIFFVLYGDKTFIGPESMSKTEGVWQNQELLTLREYMGSPQVIGRVHVAHLFSFLWCVICFVCLRYLSCALLPMLPVLTPVLSRGFHDLLLYVFAFLVVCCDSPIKTMSGLSLPPVVVCVCFRVAMCDRTSTVWVTWLECMGHMTWLHGSHDGCFVRSRNCLPFASTRVYNRFSGGVCVAHLFNFLCCDVFFVLFVFVLCLVCRMFPASLDFPYLIAPSVFYM